MAQSSMERVEAAANALGLDITITLMADTTRTAEDAAAACGCAVGQIVKSLIFQRADDASFVLLLVSGAHQVDLEKAAKAVGGKLERADAKAVRAETGFAIGGVAPIGSKVPLATFLDETLLDFDTVWAAAGRPNAVFQVAPQRLADKIGAVVADLKG